MTSFNTRNSQCCESRWLYHSIKFCLWLFQAQWNILSKQLENTDLINNVFHNKPKNRTIINNNFSGNFWIHQQLLLLQSRWQFVWLELCPSWNSSSRHHCSHHLLVLQEEEQLWKIWRWQVCSRFRESAIRPRYAIFFPNHNKIFDWKEIEVWAESCLSRIPTKMWADFETLSLWNISIGSLDHVGVIVS